MAVESRNNHQPTFRAARNEATHVRAQVVVDSCLLPRRQNRSTKDDCRQHFTRELLTLSKKKVFTGPDVLAVEPHRRGAARYEPTAPVLLGTRTEEPNSFRHHVRTHQTRCEAFSIDWRHFKDGVGTKRNEQKFVSQKE
jgi:hypothetical protein